MTRSAMLSAGVLAGALLMPLMPASGQDASSACAQRSAGPTVRREPGITTGRQVRLVRTDGTSIEGRVTAFCQNALEVAPTGRGSEVFAFAGIRSAEVYAPPASRAKSSMIGAVVGAIAGAALGAAAHDPDAQGSPAYGSPPGKAENTLVGAAFGGAVGWAIGRFVVARSRWQVVPLP